jgi:hypothetical protein
LVGLHVELKTNMKIDKLFTVTALIYLGALIFNLALLAAIIWVAWHFISKWW